MTENSETVESRAEFVLRQQQRRTALLREVRNTRSKVGWLSIAVALGVVAIVAWIISGNGWVVAYMLAFGLVSTFVEEFFRVDRRLDALLEILDKDLTRLT